MATASDNSDVSIRVMEEDLSCYICYNLLREPKELDCTHIYCLQCLLEWTKNKPTIECPECRHITVVPQGGLTNLKTNLRLKAMTEKYSERVEKHKDDVLICPNHSGERQHFFCATCGITVCNNCLVLEHPRPQHDIKELKIIAKSRKAEMKTKMDRVMEEVKKESDAKITVDDMTRRLETTADKAEKDVNKRAQEIVDEAEARGKQMIARVQATRQQRMETLRETETRVTDRLTRLQNVHSAMQNVVYTASDHVYMKQHASLIDKMEKLCITQQNMLSEDVANIRFDPKRLDNQAWFGEVVTSGNKELKLDLIAEFGTFQQALYVAATQTGLLAVVDTDSKECTTYKNDSGEYKRQFCLGASTSDPTENITRPIAVATTAEGKFLISDNGVVKVFSLAGIYERSWPVSVVTSRITTAPDDLIVIANNKQRIITVHKCNGELIRTHQTECTNFQGLASNGKQIAFTTGSKGKVFVIDFETGQTLWTLDMVYPLGICYEPRSKALLIARGSKPGSKNVGHHVIEQYCNTTGRLISRLASALHNPCTMTITHDNKLAVADLKTVKIYNIQ